MKVFYFAFAMMFAYVFFEMAVETLTTKEFKSNSLILIICLVGALFFSYKVF